MKWYHLHFILKKNASKYPVSFADAFQYKQRLHNLHTVYLLYNLHRALIVVTFVFLNRLLKARIVELH